MDIVSSNIRKRILKMAYDCGRSVHIGGSMSMVEILTVLYRDVMKFNIKDMEWDKRDRFFLSKGHCVMALFAVMAELGVISDEEMATYMQDGSCFGSHPVMDIVHGIECSSGSLGQGISMAVGAAKAAKIQNKDHMVYTLVGNGECDEGSVWESFMLAGQWKLSNLTIIIDNNGLQSDGESVEIIDLRNISKKLEGFGLKVLEVDGHNEEALLNAFQEPFDNMAKVIICNTIKGKGISFMENDNEWHHNRLIEEIYDKAIGEIE